MINDATIKVSSFLLMAVLTALVAFLIFVLVIISIYFAKAVHSRIAKPDIKNSMIKCDDAYVQDVSSWLIEMLPILCAMDVFDGAVSKNAVLGYVNAEMVELAYAARKDFHYCVTEPKMCAVTIIVKSIINAVKLKDSNDIAPTMADGTLSLIELVSDLSKNVIAQPGAPTVMTLDAIGELINSMVDDEDEEDDDDS